MHWWCHGFGLNFECPYWKFDSSQSSPKWPYYLFWKPENWKRKNLDDMKFLLQILGFQIKQALKPNLPLEYIHLRQSFQLFQHLSPKLCWLWTGKIISVSTPKLWSGRRYQWWWNWILFNQKVGWTITNWTISIFSTSITWEIAVTMMTMHVTTNAVTSSSWTYFMRFFIKRKKS